MAEPTSNTWRSLVAAFATPTDRCSPDEGERPMAEPTCLNADCPHRREADDLRRELRAVYRLLEARRADLARCPRHPRGERCALPAGHEGGCKRGD